MVRVLKLSEMPSFIGFFKILRENNDDDVLEEELLKHIELNKKNINHMVIAEFKNKLAALNRTLSHKNEIQEITGLNFKPELSKDQLYELKTERDEEMELLKEDLYFLALRNRD